MEIQEIGVGCIAFPGLEPVLERCGHLLDAVEIEPQTFWRRSPADGFAYSADDVEYLKALGKPVIFHGVGFPVGGTRPPDPAHIPCMRRMIGALGPRWLSEHLSFNTIDLKGRPANTAFLLPPLQTDEGIATAVASIRAYKSNFNLPFAFETGVNYLRRQACEMDDGEFIARVAEGADCHILLDLHNVWANERNGRQRVADFVAQLPRERVIEIHLAGGLEMNGYYLDAHSGAAAGELLDLTESIVKKLPALKAIVFEVLPEYLPQLEIEALAEQFARMRQIWNSRGAEAGAEAEAKSAAADAGSRAGAEREKIAIADWEQALGQLALGKEPPAGASCAVFAPGLKADAGLAVVRELSDQFRNGSLFSSMKFTCRYLMLSLGAEKGNEVLADFWNHAVPKLNQADNGLNFAEFLLARETGGDLPLLKDLVTYEKNSLLTLMDGCEREVGLSHHPWDIIKPLRDFELPADLTEADYRVRITPD